MKNGITVTAGNLADQEVDVIVLSAHTSVRKGSGMSMDVHRRAGPLLEMFGEELAPIEPGSAGITPGFELPAHFVIHAVSPKLRFGQKLRETDRATWASMLEAIYYNCLLSGCKSIAIPPIGVGGHRIPAEFALPSLAEFAVRLHKDLGIPVVLVSNDVLHRRIWRRALAELNQANA